MYLEDRTVSQLRLFINTIFFYFSPTQTTLTSHFPSNLHSFRQSPINLETIFFFKNLISFLKTQIYIKHLLFNFHQTLLHFPSSTSPQFHAPPNFHPPPALAFRSVCSCGTRPARRGSEV